MRNALFLAFFLTLGFVIGGCQDEPATWRPVQPTVSRDSLPPITLPSPASGDSADAGSAPAADAVTPDFLAPSPAASGPDKLQAPDSLNGEGLKMPTQHSHWLRGTIVNARVTVTLNGLYLGSFTSGLDRDITMSCRPGANTIVFSASPLSPGALARLEVVEGEHDPPIPALLSCRLPTGESKTKPASETANNATPAEQTFSFIAR